VELLAKKPSKVNVKLLRQYPEFQEFQNLKGTRRGGKKDEPELAVDLESATPSEVLERAYGNLRDELAEELLGVCRTEVLESRVGVGARVG
jgi:restriction system protein